MVGTGHRDGSTQLALGGRSSDQERSLCPMIDECSVCSFNERRAIGATSCRNDQWAASAAHVLRRVEGLCASGELCWFEGPLEVRNSHRRFVGTEMSDILHFRPQSLRESRKDVLAHRLALIWLNKKLFQCSIDKGMGLNLVRPAIRHSSIRRSGPSVPELCVLHSLPLHIRTPSQADF